MSSPSDWQCVHNGWEQEESPHKIWHKLQHCVYIIDPCLLERFPWLLSLPKSEMGTNQDHIKPYTYFTFRPINSTLRLCTCTCLCHKKKNREKKWLSIIIHVNSRLAHSIAVVSSSSSCCSVFSVFVSMST